MPGQASRMLTPEEQADFVALQRLTAELRRAKPNLYVNITTGTWPSPFWLWCSDSVWRGGADCGFCGEGSMRQQWINYRDAITQQLVVRRSPLYPLNSVMNQGITYARRGAAARMTNDLKDLKDEFRMFFADGAQLQELYMTPQMMTPAMWDVLAEAAKMVASQRGGARRHALGRRRREQGRSLRLRGLVAAEGDHCDTQPQQQARLLCVGRGNGVGIAGRRPRGATR